MHVVAPGSPGCRVVSGVTVWTVGGGDLFGWPGMVARLRERPARLGHLPPFAARAAHRLRALDASRVVAHFLLPAGIVALAARAPIELVGHGSDVRLLARLPGRATLVRAWLDRGASVRFVSSALLDLLAASLPAPLGQELRRASHVAPPLVEVHDVADRARELRRRARRGRELWVSVGRLVPGKRVERGIALAAAAGADLVVVGDGPERARLEAVAASRRVRATFVGKVERREALAWIAASDRVVHTSAAEGASSVLAEAAALGVPVVGAER